MIGKDLKHIQSFYEYKKEKLAQLNIRVPSDEFIYNKYDIIKDNLNRIKIKLNIFKGISYADRENYETNRLKMIRIKVDYSQLLSKKAISITDIVVKETIENVDIQFDLLETFLKKKYKGSVVRKALLPIWEKYNGSEVGTYLGHIYLNYEDFIKLNEFLKPFFGLTQKKCLR